MVVILPPGQTQADLNDPDTSFGSLDERDTYQESFCDQDMPSAKAYITAEFSDALRPDDDLFVVGGKGIAAPNDRPDQYTNGLLCFSGRYVFFVRAYSETIGSQVRQCMQRRFDQFVRSACKACPL